MWVQGKRRIWKFQNVLGTELTMRERKPWKRSSSRYVWPTMHAERDDMKALYHANSFVSDECGRIWG